ncbi:hypothetical protein ABPH35_05040 [Streptococcus sp. ZJ93]|uniref:hypothetical protein n=1 Tax=Streptococcus handemini TaxID=3161188 RepID=UPI0032EFCE67
MKSKTYTFICNRDEREFQNSSKTEQKFEERMEQFAQKYIQSNQREFNKGFIHVVIGE